MGGLKKLITDNFNVCPVLKNNCVCCCLIWFVLDARHDYVT